MSISDFVKNVCDDFRLDFFWELVYAGTSICPPHIPEQEIKWGLIGQPVIKLRTSPKGRRSDVNMHSIESTVQFLKQEIIAPNGTIVKPAYPVNSYSSGIEETDELSSVMLTGANRNMLIEASGGVVTGWTYDYDGTQQSSIQSITARLTELNKQMQEAEKTYHDHVVSCAEQLRSGSGSACEEQCAKNCEPGDAECEAACRAQCQEQQQSSGYDTTAELSGMSVNDIFTLYPEITAEKFPILNQDLLRLQEIPDQINDARQQYNTILNQDAIPMPMGNVWALYFGQDRFNKPQVMFDDIYWTDKDWSIITYNPVTKKDEPLRRPVSYRSGKVRLDTYELYPSLRFFTNPQSYGPDGKQAATADWGNYTFPDYISVSETELRASASVSLFWEMVVQMKGDLYKLFIDVLDMDVLDNLISISAASTTRGQQPLTGSGPDTWLSKAVVHKANTRIRPAANFTMNFANTNPATREYRRVVLNIIHDDLINIASWAHEITQAFYGEMDCTPFYFTENRRVYDDQGYQLYSYEPTMEGFRESGVPDVLGLEATDPLATGKRGLETFMTAQGKVQSFLRYWDPLIPVVSNAIQYKGGTESVQGLPEGSTGTNLPLVSSMPGIQGGITINGRKNAKSVYRIRQIDLTSYAPRDVVLTDEYLYYPASSVDYIQDSNLVVVSVSRPVCLYNASAAEGRYDYGVDYLVVAQMITSAKTANKQEWDRAGIPKETQDKLLKKQEDEMAKCANRERQSQVGGSGVYSMMLPEAARPLDGVYGVQCNFARYGPWSVSNGNGKAKFDKNTSLAPWTYSNKYMKTTDAHAKMHERAIMQLAGELSSQRWGNCSEQGQITFGGLPSVGLGTEISDVVLSYMPLAEKIAQMTAYQQMGNVLIEHDPCTKLPLLKKELSVPFLLLYGLLDAYIGNAERDGTINGLNAETIMNWALNDKVNTTLPRYEYFHLPYRPLGLMSPVISRVEVSFSETGPVTTKYSVNKETPRTGFLAKQFIEKIEAVNAMIKGGAERYDVEVQRYIETWSNNLARSRARDISDMGLKGRAAGRIQDAQNVTGPRGQSSREHFGKRAHSESPHDVIMGSIIGEIKEKDQQEGKTVSKDNMGVMARSVINFGDTYQDLTRMLETTEGYANKAFMSIDALLTPYATTDIQDAKLLEKELQLTIQENNQNKGSAPATGNDATPTSNQTPYAEDFLIPTFKKPKSIVSSVYKFSDLASLEKYNETGEITAGAVQQTVMNSQLLNPLVNPKEIDHNDLATDPVMTTGKSEFGHNVGVISKGIVPPRDVSVTAARLDDDNPYHPHYRALSLTAPLVLTGWGRNQDGKPVPRPYDSADYYVPNHPSRRDLWATGPVELVFDENRGVWCSPSFRMHYVMLVKDMYLVDNTNQVKRDFSDYDEGYDAGEKRGKQDKQTETSNLKKPTTEQAALLGLDYQGMVEHSTAWSDGHKQGYEGGYHGTPKPERVMPMTKFSRGPAKIMDDPLGTVSYINVDMLSDARLQKGDFTLAFYSNGHWLAVPNGLSIRTGIVTRRIEPVTYLDKADEETGEVLSGGGWVAELSQGATTNTQIKAFCGMVTTTEHSIPEGVFVQYIYLNGRAWIIGKHC